MSNKRTKGEEIFCKEKELKGYYFTALFLNKLLSVLKDTKPKKAHALFLRKMPRLRAIPTALLRHPKWARILAGRNIYNISLEKSRVVGG